MAVLSLLNVLAICVVPAFSAPNVLSVKGRDNHSPAGYSAPYANIDSGVVIGKTASVSDSNIQVRQFLGIPFAQPPVGDLRFAPPQAVHPWTQPLNATSYSDTCFQDFGSGETRTFNQTLFNTPPPVPNVESEDCLYINVFVPDCGCPKEKAVLFWIYGGGFNFGSGSLPLYDGSYFAAKQDIIVVTFNYRTNLFGFPRSPQLPLTGQNLGYLDQRLALDWVKRNIRSFGGDPDKVTIAGESAGAVSVDDLVTTMPDNPPFRGAILESGQETYPIPPTPPANITTSWDALMVLLGCTKGTESDILACARAADGNTLSKLVNDKGLGFGSPVADNVTRLQYPYLAHLSGKVAQVPTFAGSNYNDGSVFAIPYGSNVSNAIAANDLTYWQSELLKIYSPGTIATQGLTTGNEIIAKLISDSTFFCPSLFYSNLTATKSQVPAWTYLFNATFPNTQHPEYALLDLGVYHSSELPLVFGTYPKQNQTTGEEQLSQRMQSAWANFVKDPHAGPGFAPYPSIEVFGADTQKAIVAGVNVTDIDQDCTVWGTIFEEVLSKLL